MSHTAASGTAPALNLSCLLRTLMYFPQGFIQVALLIAHINDWHLYVTSFPALSNSVARNSHCLVALSPRKMTAFHTRMCTAAFTARNLSWLDITLSTAKDLSPSKNLPSFSAILKMLNYIQRALKAQSTSVVRCHRHVPGKDLTSSQTQRTVTFNCLVAGHPYITIATGLPTRWMRPLGVLVLALSSMGGSRQPCSLHSVDCTEPSMPLLEAQFTERLITESTSRTWRFIAAFTCPSKSPTCWPVDITSCMEPTHWRQGRASPEIICGPSLRTENINCSFSTLLVGIGEEKQPRGKSSTKKTYFEALEQT